MPCTYIGRGNLTAVRTLLDLGGQPRRTSELDNADQNLPFITLQHDSPTHGEGYGVQV
jgi:hypothetical protein